MTKKHSTKRSISPIEIAQDIEGLLARFNSLDPNSEQTNLMPVYDEKDIICVLTKHFEKNKTFNIKRLAQILMLLNFAYRHDIHTYKNEIKRLEHLLHTFKFDLLAILDYVSKAPEDYFYTNFNDVLIENLAVLKTRIVYEVSFSEHEIDKEFQSFVAKMLDNVESISFKIKTPDNPIKLGNVIQFMQKFPFRDLLHIHKQSIWWHALTFLALKNNFPKLKKDFFSYVINQLKDENHDLDSTNKEWLLEAINAYIALGDRLSFSKQIAKEHTNCIKEKLLELNLISDLQERLMQQCNKFIEHSPTPNRKACIITPRVMFNILKEDKDLIKDILIADFSTEEWVPDLELSLQQYSASVTHFEKQIRKISELEISARNKNFSSPIVSEFDNFKQVLQEMATHAYNNGSIFGKPETCYFKISLGIKSNESNSGYIYDEIHCAITYLGNSKYLWSNPDMIAGVCFYFDEIHGVASYLFEQSQALLNQSVANNLSNQGASYFIVRSYFYYKQEDKPKNPPLLLSNPLPRRSITPAGLVSDGKKQIPLIPRAQTNPNFCNLKN